MEESKNLVFAIIFFVLVCVAFAPFYENFERFREKAEQVQINNDSLLTPFSGRHVLPQEARAVLAAIDSLKLPNFKLCKSLEHNNAGAPEAYQRINESCWPIRNEANSNYWVGFSQEIDTIKHLKIVYRNANISVGVVD